jgi:hypothetical protein
VLFPAALWPGIEDGTVTVAFRSWKRPSVKAGGTLLTPVGQLAIDAVDVIDAADITDEDARLAGAADADDVRARLRPDDDRHTYRVAFHRLGDDPRIALRADAHLDDAERDAIHARLAGHDRRSPTGPWTTRTLELIRDHPAVVSTELAERLGIDRAPFKLNVRKLKALGLTESLEVGYRLSPRGVAYLAGET